MKKIISFLLPAAFIFAVSCSDDNKADNIPNANIAEFTQKSSHAICNFYKSYNISAKQFTENDSIDFYLYNSGRTFEEIQEQLLQLPPFVREYDICESNDEILHYCKMFNDTCFNASNFGTLATLDTIANISISYTLGKGIATNINKSTKIEYYDIKKIVGTNKYADNCIEIKDFDWHVSESLTDFNNRNNNYLIANGEVRLKVPSPSVSGNYIYTITYTCTNGKQFVIKDTILIK